MTKKLLKHLPISLNGKRIKLLQLKALFLEGTIAALFTILKYDLDFKSKNSFIMDNPCYFL